VGASQVAEVATPSGERPAPEARVRNAYETVTKGGTKAAETGAETIGPAVDESTLADPLAGAPMAASETQLLLFPDDPAEDAHPNVVCSAPNGTTQIVVGASQVLESASPCGDRSAHGARVRNAYETVTKGEPKASETGAEAGGLTVDEVTAAHPRGRDPDKTGADGSTSARSPAPVVPASDALTQIVSVPQCPSGGHAAMLE
jgi:hypothetical protein